MRRVVSVWLPRWSTDRIRKRLGDTLPADRPLVVSFHDGRRRVVTAVDKAAGMAGLAPNMPLARAQALVPDLKIVELDPDGDARALAALAAWSNRFGPLSTASFPDNIWIDITGCAHLFGGEAALLNDLRRRLANQGFAARAAVAETPGAAWAIARHGAKPAEIVESGQSRAALLPLPIRALRLAPALCDTLLRLGFERIGDLVEAPRAPLARRFGLELLQRLDQALGCVFEPITPVFPPDIVQCRKAFPEPLLTAEAFAAIIPRLTAGASAELERRGEGARRLDLLFERVDGSVQAICIGTARPSRDPTHLGRLLLERLDSVDPEPGVEAMRLVVPLCEPIRPAQLANELAGGGTDAGVIAPLIDRLTARFGTTRVFAIQPTESYVPERSLRCVPPLQNILVSSLSIKRQRHREEHNQTVIQGPSAAALNRLAASRLAKTARFGRRPARLLEPPQPVEAIAELPDHPPVRFVWRKVFHTVRRAEGPERVRGEWWQRDVEYHAIRDYFAVEDERGVRFWLYRRGEGRNPATGDLRWFLHGIF